MTKVSSKNRIAVALAGAILAAACQQATPVLPAGNSVEPSVGTAADTKLAISDLEITCHELIGGEPSPSVTTYVLRGAMLYSISPNQSPILISEEGSTIQISTTQDDEGLENSLATHTRDGDRVIRTVFWQRPGQNKRVAFTEVYDFRNQLVVDSETGEDSCNHEAVISE